MKESAVLDRVLRTISRYSMLAPDARVAVAVSGGPDSVCLLHVLRELAPHLGVTVAAVAHFNHKLRGEAAEEDERFVGAMAAEMGVPFHRAEAEVSASAGNLEQAARRARRGFFFELMRGGVADRVALGHTRDDQAETVLFRLLRGSGLAGLAGIYPVTADGFVRPLIDSTRNEVEGFLRSRGIPSRFDATNRDPRFARNRIRHGLLPKLRDEWNPNIVDTLANLADLAREEERFWKTQIDRIAGDTFVAGNPGLELAAAALAALPKAAARRLVRHAIAQVKGDLRRIEFSHIEQVLVLASANAGEGKIRLPGIDVIRSFDRLRMEAIAPQLPVETVPVAVPGRYPAPDGNTQVCFEVTESKRTTDMCANLKGELSWQRIPAPLELRGWRPGDHYRPVGQSRDKKVQEMFQRARVPFWQRRFWPIVTSGGKILWARRFGAAEEFAATEDSGPVLCVWEAKQL